MDKKIDDHKKQMDTKIDCKFIYLKSAFEDRRCCNEPNWRNENEEICPNCLNDMDDSICFEIQDPKITQKLESKNFKNEKKIDNTTQLRMLLTQLENNDQPQVIYFEKTRDSIIAKY